LGGQIGEASSAREREGEHTGSGVARCAGAPRRRGCRAGCPPAAGGAQGHPGTQLPGAGSGGALVASGAWCGLWCRWWPLVPGVVCGVDWWSLIATGWAGLARD